MTDKEELMIRRLFDDKISEFHEEVFGKTAREIPLNHPGLKILTKRWTDYLKGLGVSFMPLGEAQQKWDEPGRFKLTNPFYVDNHRRRVMDMSIETAEKILVLGLP